MKHGLHRILRPVLRAWSEFSVQWFLSLLCYNYHQTLTQMIQCSLDVILLFLFEAMEALLASVTNYALAGSVVVLGFLRFWGDEGGHLGVQWMCTWGQELFSTLFSEIGLSWNLKLNNLCRLLGQQPPGTILSFLLSTGIISMYCVPGFLCEFWGIELRPNASKASFLATESSLFVAFFLNPRSSNDLGYSLNN